MTFTLGAPPTATWEVVKPKRIQRRRTKGWRMPEDAIYVGRPTRWGNTVALHGRTTAIRVGDVYDWPTISTYFEGSNVEFLIVNGLVTITPELAVAMFRLDIANWNHDTRTRWLAPLRGRDLVCWCRLDQPCHADVLLELANA